MRHIGIAEGLKLRFPSRSKDFDEGVEVGLAIAEMSAGQPTITRTIGAGTLVQLRSVASKFGYRVVELGQDGSGLTVQLVRSSIRPSLKVVSS